MSQKDVFYLTVCTLLNSYTVYAFSHASIEDTGPLLMERKSDVLARALRIQESRLPKDSQELLTWARDLVRIGINKGEVPDWLGEVENREA